MTSEIIAALIGAGIALISGVAGALLQHLLLLRADKIKRERDRQEAEAAERRAGLLDGVRDFGKVLGQAASYKPSISVLELGELFGQRELAKAESGQDKSDMELFTEVLEVLKLESEGSNERAERVSEVKA